MPSIDTIRAVHHPTRSRIIDHLYLHGPGQVGVLARDLEQQVGSISHHLRVLERAEIVERAPELSTDGRSSWWRLRSTSLTWSVDDFADSAAERMQAKAAERAHIDRQLAKLAAWKKSADAAPAAWRRASFNTTFTASATAAEFHRLQEQLHATMNAWRDSIDADDGQEREPVFAFVHGFPSQP